MDYICHHTPSFAAVPGSAGGRLGSLCSDVGLRYEGKSGATTGIFVVYNSFIHFITMNHHGNYNFEPSSSQL